jgi:uncharacterized protein YijF (DUF1287 family)
MEELFSQSSDELIDNNANPPEVLPDGIYTYPGVDALYKKENGQWFKKVGGSTYIQLKDGNVVERIKRLESNAIPVPKEKEEIQRFTNIQDFDVIQPAQQYRDVFEPQNNLLVKPKKEEKTKDIRIVDNDGIKTWQEEKEKKLQQKTDPKTGIPMGPSYFTVYEDITDPTRVANLNKSFKEDASTSKEQKVFTGYPGKQGTEYVINEDNLWEVKRPGSDDFLIISNVESVNSLNNHFKQNADIFDDNKAIEIKSKNKQTLDLRYRINKVDKKLISGTEENAQEVLENLFPEYEFEQFGIGTDNIRVKSKSNEIEISLDNWSNESDDTEALRLRSFLRENAGDIDQSRYKAVMLQRKLDAQNKRYYGTFGFSGLQTVLETGKPKDLGLEEKTEAAREEFLIDLSSQYKDTYLRTKDKTEKEKSAAFASLKPKEEEISIINKYADDVLGQSNKLVSKQKDIEYKSKSISEESEIIKSEQSRIELYVKNINDRIKSNSISQEELDQANVYIQEQYDILNDKINTFNKEREELELDIDGINNESKSLQNNLKNVSLSQDLVNKSIASNLLIQNNKGSIIGGIAYSAVDGILSIPRMVAIADKETKDKWIKEIVGVGTTEAYINSDDRWDITKAAFQMSRSLSAMAVGSIGGTYGAYASLYAMSYYEMKDELDQLDLSGPNRVSEGDKVLMSAAYGLVGGALENFGLSYLIGKSSLKSSLSNAILKNAFSQIPKNASKEMVEAQIMNSTKMMIAKYGITALGSSLIEGGVEGTQRIAQMGIQEVYDKMKGSDYFNNKSAYEILGDVAYESYMGFLGGGIVETVQQSGNVLRDGSAAFKDKKQLNLLIDAAKTMGIDKALVSKLKSDILNGNIKKEEAEKQLNSFKEIQGKIRSIPDNMSVENQAQALDLILERDRLNQEIEGKDPNLVKPQSDRITEINNNLQELSKQNAVQEPSTEGVLQREPEGVTETGGERGGVEPIVQGEEVTKEGESTQKEVVPGATAKIADVDIVYPTEPQAEERKAFRSTSEYVENASKELPVEDVEAFTKELDGDFGLLTAENPMAQPLTEEENKQLNQKAEEWLTGRGYKPRRVTGKYGQAENSFFVPNLTRQDAIDFAKQFNQEAVAHSDGLVYQDGSMNPRVKADDNLSFTESYSPDSDFVSVVNTKDGLKTFSIGYNFDQKVMPSDIDDTPKFQKEPKTEQEFEQQIEGIKSEMNQMPDEVSNFDVPSNLTTKNKTNVKSIISRFGDKLKKAWKGGIIKNVTDYSGIPMIFTISDQLGAGKVKNPFTNTTIDINGGINFNLTEGNENNAWANTTKEEAEKMLSRAQEIYGKNKDLFDRLWKEGKLPNGQIPMAIVKMGQESIQTNEALFGFASETIKKKFNKTERTNSLNGLIKDIESFDPKSKVLKFIQENNYKTIDELLDNVNKLKLGERAIITRFLFTGGIELNKETKPGKPKSNSGLALVGNRDSSYYKYIHLNTINNIIQDESTKEIPSNHIIGITGVDVLNPEITKPNHRNYPYGVKGGLIGIIESPVHAADVFPEMYSKSFYLNKENKSGKLPSVGQVISQTVASSGAVTSTKAFRGAKLSTKMTDIQKLLGKLKLAFPSVTIVDTKEEFEKELNKPEVKKFIKDGDIVYGFTKDGKIFLNPEKANSNTAIHEFSHLWMEFLKKNNPNLLKKGYSLLEGTSILKEKIKEFGDNELAREEAMAELIANKGETLIEAGKKSKFKNWLNAVFNYVKSKFKSFDKLSPEQFQNITLNEFVDGSLKSLLKGEEITTEEIKGAGIKFQKQSKDNAIQDAKDKYEMSVEKRGKDHNTGVTAAIADLQKSDWYRDADDIQREESIREIKKFFGEKLKAAPSIAKVTGKTKQTAFVSDLAAAIRDQVKLQARSSRETAKNINDRRKALGVAIKQVVSQYKGKITERQLKSINNRIAGVNLFNQEMVDRVISYVDKVMNNADYANKVNNAFAERRAIRRMMKSGNMSETVAVAKEFTQIDPSMVDDIDAYLEMAEKIRGAVKKSKRVKDSVSLKQIVNFGEAYEYIKPVLDAQEESMKNMRLAEYNELVDAGVISKEMTLKEINSVINNIRNNEEAGVKEEQENAAKEVLKNKLDYIKKLLSLYTTSVGYNALTGEPTIISARNRQMIQKIIKSDMNNMSTKQLIEMVDSLSNFFENGAVGGIEAAYSTYVGEENAASLEREGVVARPLKMYFNKKLGQIFGTELTSLNELFNRMFVGAKKGMEIMTKSGFSDVILGANKARRQVKEIQDRYVQRFGKNKNFFQIENVYERGVFAFLSRNIIGSESEVKAEFNRRVDMLLESVEALKNGTAKEQEMAKVYEKVLDKLDVKSRDLFSIERKMSLSNWDATQWWINEWSSHYSDLSDVSRSVYNTILGKDINYTPDRYKSTTEGSSQGIDNNLVERNSAFLINTDAITDTNESGVMIASVRPKVLPKGRYVSLDFDVNNIDSLTGALVDINTAGAIRQVDSFFKSKSFKSIVPSVEDRRILTERVNRYIRRSKNKLSVPSDVFRNIDNALNTVSSVGTALGLGGVFQTVKQTVSVAISTAIQTGTSFKIYAGQDFNNWLNTTGASVANRGQESLTAIESANKKIQSFNGTFDKAIDTYKNLTQWQLRLFLSRPDVFVARAAFKSYYEQFLKSKGYDVSEINWATWDETIKKYGIEDLSKQAVVYADTMVSRQQNVSDERLAGELLASEDSARKLIRKALLPFASFSINQRARLVADINALFLNWKNISSEDKAIAIKSIAGTTAEQGVFQLINFGIGMALYSVAQSITGHDDDDEDWNKRMRNATKYPIKSLLADMISPNPLADDAVVFGADQLLSMFGSPSESEIKQAIKDEEESRKLLGKKPMTEAQINEFKEQYKKDNTYQLAYNFSNAEEGKYGMFSIAYDQYVKLAENSEMADKGTFTDDYMGKETTKYLTDKDKSIAKSVFYGLEVPYSTGAGVKEMGQVANKTYSILRKRALTESQYEVYKEFKKEFKREPQEWEIKMIKTNKNTGKILGAINYVQDNGGLSNKQGIEYLNVFKKTGSIPTIYTFRMIEQGKSSKYILNKMLENRNKSNNDEVIFD